jgi:hypothetical protein
MNSILLLIETIVRFRLDRDRRIALILKRAQRGQVTEFQARAYLNWLERRVQWQIDVFNPLHRPPEPEQLYADGVPVLELGTLSETPDLRIGLPIHGAVHPIFSGRTGTGKTTAMRRLILAIDAHNRSTPQCPICVICILRKPGDTLDLPDLLGRDRWQLFDLYEDLQLALHPPPGVPCDAWIHRIVSCFCARAQLQYGWVSLADIMRWLVGVLNTQPGGELIFPSFELMLDVIYAAPKLLFSSKTQYTDSVTQALEGIEKASGRLFRAFRGLDLVRDVLEAGKCAVISIPNLEPYWLRQFVCDLLLSQVLLSRMHRLQRTDRVTVLFAIDEADQDCNYRAEKAFADGMPPISECLKQGREFGISVCLGLSALRPISRMVLGNSTHHFTFAMGDEEGSDEACRTLFLPPSAKPLLESLTPGVCMFRQAGSWPHAMLATIDFVPPNRSPRPTQFDSHPVVPSKRLHELPEVQQALRRRIGQAQGTKLRHEKWKQDEVSNLARDLLDVAAAHPYEPVARLWSRIGTVPFAKQKRVYGDLTDRELAEFEEIRIGRANVLLIWLTAKAWQMLRGQPPTKLGRGGIAHRHFALWIERLLQEQGFEARREFVVPDTNHPLDVGYELEGLVHGFEVCVKCITNITSHLEACFVQSKAVADITIVAPVRIQLQSIQSTVRARPSLSGVQGRIQYEVVEHYMKTLFPR